MTVWTFLAFALSTLGGQERVSTLQIGDTVVIERAVAEYTARVLLPRLPAGPLAFDSRDESGNERSSERIRSLESALGGKATHEEAVVVCGRGPGTCQMKGYARFVRLKVSDLTDSTASATVTLQWPSGQPRIPVYLREPVLLFQKRDNQWQFVRLVSERDT
jgi:hypothetical protein